MEHPHSNSLTHLIISEAVKYLENKYDLEGIPEKNGPIEAHMCELGKKPGFALIGLICKNGQDFESIDDAGKFLATRFSNIILNSPGSYSITSSPQKSIIITYPKVDRIALFGCLSGQSTHQSSFWFKNYAAFFQGVFTGALTHMGYSVTSSFEQPNAQSLQYKFVVEELDQSSTWEFDAKSH